VGRAIKEMTEKKATDDDVTAHGLKLLGEDGLKLMTQLINNIQESGEWCKDATEVIIKCLKEAKSYKIQWPTHMQQI
jgi:hypothetical protein